jgi:hypothetical protein
MQGPNGWVSRIARSAEKGGPLPMRSGFSQTQVKGVGQARQGRVAELEVVSGADAHLSHGEPRGQHDCMICSPWLLGEEAFPGGTPFSPAGEVPCPA